MQEEKPEEDNIETNIINKLKKTVIIKKVLSDKQKAHIDKLGDSKRGSKYTKVVQQEDIKNIPVEIKEKKVKKVKKVKEIVIPVQSETESTSSEESEIIIVKPKPKKSKKKKVLVESSDEEIKVKIVKKEVVYQRRFPDIF